MSWFLIVVQLISSILPPFLIGFSWYQSIMFGLMSFFLAKKFPTANLFITFPCWVIGFLGAAYSSTVILLIYIVDFLLYSAFFFVSPALKMIDCEDRLKNQIICSLFLFFLFISSQFFLSYNSLMDYHAFRQTSASYEYQQYLMDKSDSEEMVWISQSGEKYHDNPNCSGMNSPKEVTRKEAKEQGYTACSKCY